MPKFLEYFQVNSAMHAGSRQWKDRWFLPVAKLCATLHLSPVAITTIGLIIGLLSAGLLFVNYWYFVIGFVLSTLLDGIDGTLARYTKTTSKFGARYDYATDLTLTLVIYIAITVWLGEPMWIIGLNAFGILLLLNYLLKSPLKIFPGRMWLIVPMVLGLPRIGLATLLVYVAAMYVLLIMKLNSSTLTHWDEPRG